MKPWTYDNPVFQCSRVVDGDTQEIYVDLGYGLLKSVTTRIEGVDAPEHNTIAGKLVTQVVANWFSECFKTNRYLWWKSAELDVYRRSVGDFYMKDNPTETFSSFLFSKHIARPYDGKRARLPWGVAELAEIEFICRDLLKGL